MNKKLKHIVLRDELMKATRAFFAKRNFCEVIPPVLNDAVPNEPGLHPFVTQWIKGAVVRDFYLPTSPERSLKMALSQGLGNCFSIGHCFRNLEGSGSLHSPEFLMLEWYKVHSTYQDIMKEVQEYIEFVSKQLNPIVERYLNESHRKDQPSLHSIRSPAERDPRICTPTISATASGQSHQVGEFAINQWKIFSIKERFENVTGIRYENLLTEDQILVNVAKKLNYTIENASWREIFDQVFVNEIEAGLPNEPVFLVDFPSRISPLCKKKSDAPHIAERFELYIGGVEIANGNNENTNVTEIREVFEKEIDAGKSPLDTQFLDALHKMDTSGRSFAGVGLGLDRLMMLMMGEENISTF